MTEQKQIKEDFVKILTRDIGKAIAQRTDIYRTQLSEGNLALGCAAALSASTAALIIHARDCGTSPEALDNFRRGIVKSIEDLSA